MTLLLDFECDGDDSFECVLNVLAFEFVAWRDAADSWFMLITVLVLYN